MKSSGNLRTGTICVQAKAGRSSLGNVKSQRGWVGKDRKGLLGCRDVPTSICASVLSRLCAAIWPRYKKFNSGTQMPTSDSWGVGGVNTDTHTGKQVGHFPRNGTGLNGLRSHLVW